MANVDEKKSETAKLEAKSSEEIEAVFSFLPLLRDFLDDCMKEGSVSTNALNIFMRKWEIKKENCVHFIKTIPYSNKTIHELKIKRDTLISELKRKKNVE